MNEVKLTALQIWTLQPPPGSPPGPAPGHAMVTAMGMAVAGWRGQDGRIFLVHLALGWQHRHAQPWVAGNS